MLNRKTKDQLNYQLNINGLFSSEKKKIAKIANNFNHYFVNVADKLCNKIPKNNNYQDFLKNPNKSSFFIQETTPHEVSLIIHSLKSSSTTDIFGYTTKFIKIASPALVYTLSANIQQFNYGRYISWCYEIGQNLAYTQS